MQQELLNDPTIAQGRFVSQLTRNTIAFVLAGGRGSRLMQLTDWRSKPAVPFGGKFRILDFTLSNCVNSGIRRIGVATQYKAQSLIRHLQRGWSFLDGRFREAIDLLPAQQQINEDWYLGTANAVFQNMGLMRRNAPKYVIILSGDHIYKMDYGKMLAQHVQRGADMSIACIDVPIKEATGFGVMHVDEHSRVIDFVEKPAAPALHSGRAGPRPGQHGHLRLQRRVPLRAADPRRRHAGLEPRLRQGHHSPLRQALPDLRPQFRRQLRRLRRRASAPTGATSAPSTPTGKPTWN